MELFRNTNIDFLGKKWYFLAFSLVFSVAGLLSMFFWHGIPFGVDFQGGTLVYVKFASTPDLDQIRTALDRAGLKDPKIQAYGPAANNEVLVALEQRETSESHSTRARTPSLRRWRPSEQQAGKQDLNNTSPSTSAAVPAAKDPLHFGGIDAPAKYLVVAQQIDDFRNKQRVAC